MAFVPALLGLACDGSADDSWSGPTRTDSAGVEIVTVPMHDSTRNRWTTALEPELRIGVASGPPHLALDQVIGAVRLDDGRIVIANRGSSELRYFDADGTFLSASGRDGEGPGEFRYLSFLAALPGDSVLAYDRSLQRASLFDPAGSFVRSWSTGVSGAPSIQRPVGVSASGELLLVGFVGRDPDVAGSYFVSEVVGAFDRAEERYVALDTAGGSEAAMVEREGRLRSALVPFGRKSDFAVAGPHVFVLDGMTEREVRVFSVGGELLHILRFEYPDRPIDGGMTDRWVESFFEKNRHVLVNERIIDHWQYGFRNVSVPAELAPFRSLEVDTDGNVCAERYRPTETAPPLYWCYTPDGRFVRSIALLDPPHRSGFPHQDPQIEIGRDYVLGVWADELGVETVRLYRLRAAGEDDG